MDMPYIRFIIGMLDAPAIDYDKKEETNQVKKTKTAAEEIAAFSQFL